MYHNWSAIEENVLLGVPKVIAWLVWMGLMSAFQIRCKILEKTNTFLILFAFLLGSMSAVFQNLCLLWLDLAILWPKVTKNYGVSKIRVFLGLIFGISLAQSAKESWRSQNSCLSGADFWHFSGPRCRIIIAFPKFVYFCIQKCSNFVLWVSFLAGVVNWK